MNSTWRRFSCLLRAVLAGGVAWSSTLGFSTLGFSTLGLSLVGLPQGYVPRAEAVVVGIEYYDRASIDPAVSGGPVWTGEVDTVTNKLTITEWYELPRHGSEYWAPAQLPLVWPARASDGSLYDVPDDFNGKITEDFAFISDQTLQKNPALIGPDLTGMDWLEYTFSETYPYPLIPPLQPKEFLGNSVLYRPGWGGFAQAAPYDPVNNPNVTFLYETRGEFITIDGGALQVESFVPFDETIMPRLPVVSPTDTGVNASAKATVNVLYVVPEASQMLALALVGAACGAVKWRRISNCARPRGEANAPHQSSE